MRTKLQAPCADYYSQGHPIIGHNRICLVGATTSVQRPWRSTQTTLGASEVTNSSKNMKPVFVSDLPPTYRHFINMYHSVWCEVFIVVTMRGNSHLECHVLQSGSRGLPTYCPPSTSKSNLATAGRSHPAYIWCDQSATLFSGCLLACFSTLKTEGGHSSETSVNFCQTTGHHIPEDGTPYQCRNSKRSDHLAFLQN
jgi:hypothetical protein